MNDAGVIFHPAIGGIWDDVMEGDVKRELIFWLRLPPLSEMPKNFYPRQKDKGRGCRRRRKSKKTLSE